MKTLFIPAKINSEVNARKIQALNIPEKNIAIAYSIQYQDIAEKIKAILSKKYKIVGMLQILGCSKTQFPKNTQAILLISSGRFHAVSLAHSINLPIYILEQDKLRKISEEEIASFGRKKHASYMQFLNSDRIGILVSTKPGQENLKRALEMKNKMENKKPYLFLNNEIDIRQFSNFDIESWINTACPRMDFEGFTFNIDDLNFRHSKDSL